MKILLKILIIFLSLIGIFCGIILFMRAGYLDKPIKKLIVYYLSKEHIPAQLDGFHINHKGIVISHLTYPVDPNTKLELSDLVIKMGRGMSFKNPIILTDIDADIVLKNNQSNVFIKSKITGQFYHKFLTKIMKLDLNLVDLKSNSVTADNGVQEDLILGKANCAYNSDSGGLEKISCEVNFDGKTSLSLNSELKHELGQYKKVKADLQMSNIPLTMLQFVEKFSNDNAVIKQLNEMIYAGSISSGNLQINFDENFFKSKIISLDNLKGDFVVSDLEIKYSDKFPIIKKAQGKIIVEGQHIVFKVENAYSNNTLLSNGNISVEGIEVGDIKIIVDAEAKGAANELTSFVPKATLDTLEQKGVNLKKLSGLANTKINLVIPLKEGAKNIYDINSDIGNVSLKIFDDNVSLSNGKLACKFDGEKILLNGIIDINNFSSEINHQINLTDTKEFEQLLKIKTNIKNNYDKAGIVKIISGKSILNFEYKAKNNIATIKAESNLKNLNFQVEKLGIHKDYGQKTNFVLKATFEDKKNNPISFSLIGEDNLKIIGNILLGPNQKKINISTFSYKRTNVNSEITSSKDEFKVRIRGNCVDLSQANLMSFLEKGKDSSNASSNIKINVKKVKLKNDIWLTDVGMAFKCDQTRCFKGYLNSNVGTKFFKLLLKPYADREEWTITTNNAGAVLRAFDLYKNMRAGTMILTLNTSKQEVKKGETVPILDGRFNFKKFMLVDTPFLTRMVSFVSLPGLFNTLTNNKSIAFYELKGKFGYSEDIVNIIKANAEGPFFDFGIHGEVDTTKRQVAMKGYVLPSMYGLTSIIKHIPIIGKALFGGKRKGLLAAPFSINQSY